MITLYIITGVVFLIFFICNKIVSVGESNGCLTPVMPFVYIRLLTGVISLVLLLICSWSILKGFVMNF